MKVIVYVEDELRQRLKTTDAFKGRWRSTIEDQNDNKPPKRVVEDLFRQYRKKPDYVDTSDAVWILERASLEKIEAACWQRFAPFVRELRGIAGGGDPDAVGPAATEQEAVAAPEPADGTACPPEVRG